MVGRECSEQSAGGTDDGHRPTGLQAMGERH
jgi:hypothetical protein